MSQISETGYRTLSAFFDSQSDAQRAVDRLLAAGISQGDIRLVPGQGGDAAVTERSEQHRGFFAALADFFMPDEDRYTYAEGLSRGGYLVVVDNLGAAYYADALDILDDEGAVNLEEREQQWRSEGWAGYEGAATSAYGSDQANTLTDRGYSGETLDQERDEVIPVVDERLVVGKRDVNLGRVRVRSYMREEPVSADVNLHEERVTIERRPVDRPLDNADTAFRERTIEAEEHAEQAVVSKEARVTEEISLHKQSTEHHETVTDTVRKTEVEVEDDRGMTDQLRQNER